MRSIDRKFYDSKAWKTVRKQVWLEQHLLCNRCHRAVYVDGLSQYIPKEKRLKGIVHHKEYLSDDNINSKEKTIGRYNLEGLCIDCHNKEHFSSDATRKNIMFDEDGNIIERK